MIPSEETIEAFQDDCMAVEDLSLALCEAWLSAVQTMGTDDRSFMERVPLVRRPGPDGVLERLHGLAAPTSPRRLLGMGLAEEDIRETYAEHMHACITDRALVRAWAGTLPDPPLPVGRLARIVSAADLPEVARSSLWTIAEIGRAAQEEAGR